MPVEELVTASATMAGRDLTPPADAISLRPAPEALAAVAGKLAEDAPEMIVNSAAARGLEQALLEAMIDCLAHRDERADSSLARRHHALVMRRFWRVVEERGGEPLYIPEICSAIHVSERTLQACCQEHLGMSPKRYLLRRRMALARRALREGAADATSVTEIAMHYGFWDLGRFAVAYRGLFDESPSVTLRG